MSDGNHMPVSLPVRLPLLVGITTTVRSLVLRLCFFQRLNPGQLVFELAEGVRATFAYQRRSFKVRVEQAHALGRVAIDDDCKAAVPFNRGLWPALARGALKSCFHIVTAAC